MTLPNKITRNLYTDILIIFNYLYFLEVYYFKNIAMIKSSKWCFKLNKLIFIIAWLLVCLIINIEICTAQHTQSKNKKKQQLRKNQLYNRYQSNSQNQLNNLDLDNGNIYKSIK